MHDLKITAVGAEDFLNIINQNSRQEECQWLYPAQSMCGKAVRILNSGHMSMSVVCRHGLALRKSQQFQNSGHVLVAYRPRRGHAFDFSELFSHRKDK